MSKQEGNQWAYLTEFSVSSNLIDVTPSSDNARSKIALLPEVKFSGVAPGTQAVVAAMKEWIQAPRGLRLPHQRHEWLCLYCGSPNALPDTHCDKCGAPRSWLIG